MNHRYFYPSLTVVFALSMSAAAVINSSLEYAGILAGAEILTGVVLLKAVEIRARKHGRTDVMKAASISATWLFEIIVLAGILFNPVIPKYLALATLGLLAFTEIFSLELLYRLDRDYRLELGQLSRILVLAVSAIAYSFNPYYLYYGVLLTAGITLYDLLKLGYTLFDRLRT